MFALASALCGMATSLAALIACRVLQGLAGGGLQPSSQGVLLDAFPREKQGTAMTIFGMAALLAPVVGPTLGVCLLSVTMVSWEVMLSKGQEWDWLGDPFGRVQTLLVLFLLGLGGLLFHELRIANPLVNFRTLADRN